MKNNIHPVYNKISFHCSCGNTFEVCSTLKKNTVNIDICSQCHPFYTGKQRVVSKGGRIEQFNKKFL
ncbi:50S ribosomal protein L31 [Buchnera aphidicola]|uniref:50S ribosomal protein L31 n=1 Tax=Buchnera aphidicola TaxID=9 RepID=UPI0034644049